ncbi:nucleotidyltransferase domain protein [bacterium BMS3Abin03]|nr:nucleotidyltransferase domain protein [bacterium BMS3Abin03]
MDKSDKSISKKDKELIEYLREKLKSEFPDFKKLYLFGSRAKGNYHKESDYDIVVIFNQVNMNKELKVCGLVGEAEYLFDVFIELKIFTEKDFRYNPFFYEEVTKFGILYE